MLLKIVPLPDTDKPPRPETFSVQRNYLFPSSMPREPRLLTSRRLVFMTPRPLSSSPFLSAGDSQTSPRMLYLAHGKAI
jgi:hypothetical protein